MPKCRKHIKCNKILGKVIGTDRDGNYITFVKNKTYTLYDKDVDIKKDRTIELYELPDGALLSRLTPSLGIEYENSVSKKDYENTLDDTFSDKITKKALLIGTRISILTTLLEFLILLFTHHLNIAYTVLVLITSLPGNQHLLQLHYAEKIFQHDTTGILWGNRRTCTRRDIPDLWA